MNVGKFNELELISNKTLLMGAGYGEDDLDRPIIGIANSFNDSVPGHKHLREIAEQVKYGIYRGGGTPMEFGVIAVCDGVSDNHTGSKYTLPSRDIIADMVELQSRAHAFDGLVLIGSCDKIVPGMLMGALRLDIPVLFVPGGPMVSSPPFADKKKSNTTTISEGLGMFYNGELSKSDLTLLAGNCAQSCGSCQFMGTANTMCSLAEAMGMTLPGGAMIPAVFNERYRSALASGEKIVELVKKNISVHDVINRRSLENAVATLMSSGGSTNAVIHLCAIANEIGISAEEMINTIEEYSAKVPVIAKISPSSEEYDAQDLYFSGGIPEVMRRLTPFLNLDVMTCTGAVLSENLKNYPNQFGVNDAVIHDLDNPFLASGGLAIMRGNVAPDSGVAKPAAIHESARVFSGKAVCFDGEDAALTAIKDRKIKAGDVVVIRYEGPKGGPGMREMYLTLKMLNGQGLARTTAVITDGRFSGTNNGCFVGHISPEAAAGGPIALLQDGDEVTIDVLKKTVEADVTAEEFAARRKDWKPREIALLPGMMARYVENVSSAAEGAVLRINGSKSGRIEQR